MSSWRHFGDVPIGPHVGFRGRTFNGRNVARPRFFRYLEAVEGTNMSRSFSTLRILGMSWGVKTTCFEAPGVSLGGSGVSIGGVRILRVNVFLISCE